MYALLTLPERERLLLTAIFEQIANDPHAATDQFLQKPDGTRERVYKMPGYLIYFRIQANGTVVVQKILSPTEERPE